MENFDLYPCAKSRRKRRKKPARFNKRKQFDKIRLLSNAT